MTKAGLLQLALYTAKIRTAVVRLATVCMPLRAAPIRMKGEFAYISTSVGLTKKLTRSAESGRTWCHMDT